MKIILLDIYIYVLTCSLCDFCFAGSESESGSVKSYGEVSPEDAMKVSRSIMIVKPPSQSGSAPASPSGSTPPVSPFSGKVVFYFGI